MDMTAKRAKHGGEPEAHHLARLDNRDLGSDGIEVVVVVDIDTDRAVESTDRPSEERHNQREDERESESERKGELFHNWANLSICSQFADHFV